MLFYLAYKICRKIALWIAGSSRYRAPDELNDELDDELTEKELKAQQKRELTLFELNYKLDKANAEIEYLERIERELRSNIQITEGLHKNSDKLTAKLRKTEEQLNKAYHDRDLANLKIYNIGELD